MTPKESKACVGQFAALFAGKVNSAQGDLLAEKLKPYSFEVAIKAIKAHVFSQAVREGHGFPSLPALFDSLATLDREGREAAKVSEEETRRAKCNETWADVYRRQSLSPTMKVAGDVEVALRYYRGLWFGKAMKRECYKVKLLHDCVMTLWNIPGMDEASSRSFAATVFEESVDYFRRVLEQVRAELPGREKAGAA